MTGFLNGDTSSVIAGQPQLSTTAASAPNAGAYWIKVDVTSMTAANYSFQPAYGRLTIAKALLTVTPDNVSMTYGGGWPRLTYQITGFLNGDTPAVLTGAPHAQTDASLGSGVGKYVWNAATNAIASQNYTFKSVPGSLTITPAVLTVIPYSLSMVYGGAVPALRYAFQGLVNGDGPGVISGQPAMSSAASSGSPAGVYLVHVALGTLAAPNYTFNFADGAITVTKAVLKVVPSNLSMVYGSALPALTFTLQGFVNADTPLSATTGAPLLITTAASSSPVGLYDITSAVDTLVAANYTFSFQTSKLAITPAPLNVVADNKSIKIGSALPVFTFSVSGLVNGDVLGSATSGAPILSTAATATSPAGVYAITVAPGKLSSINYKLAFKNGTLTITK